MKVGGLCDPEDKRDRDLMVEYYRKDLLELASSDRVRSDVYLAFCFLWSIRQLKKWVWLEKS